MKNMAFYLGKSSATCKITSYYKDNYTPDEMIE